MSSLLAQIKEQLIYNPDEPILFNSGFFMFFLLVFLAVFFVFQHKTKMRTWFFTFFSLYFFYKACGWYVLLVIFAAVVDFVLSNQIYKTTNAAIKKTLLIFSLSLNLGVLFYFKYTDFFIDILNQTQGFNFTPLELILPIGISFYTFENISYTIDVYRGEFKPVKSFIDYLFFLSFFPKLVMGPIVRAADFIPQIYKPLNLMPKQILHGAYLIMVGLIKKVIISDFIYDSLVHVVFDSPMRFSGAECLLAVYGYALVIYCDFSGYSDMAIGLSKWVGFDISINFLSPYQSKNITEFWRRWHISLSSWLRDYLYIPLGGNKLGDRRQYLNLIVTMLLGGFWHGANFTFIIWGAWHGLGLALHKGFSSHIKWKLVLSKMPAWLGCILTFHFVCVGWVFFKSADVGTAFIMLKQIFTGLSYDVFMQAVLANVWVVYMIGFGFMAHAISDNFAVKMIDRIEIIPLWFYVFVFTLLIILLVQFKTATPILPVYLQF